jgi:spore germination protein YaaH
MLGVRASFTVSCVTALVFSGACSSLPLVGRAAPERWAFAALWDERSAVSARAHAAALDALVSEHIALDSITGAPTTPYPDSLSVLMPASGRRMALVTTFAGQTFHPAVVRRLALDSALLRRTAAVIADRMGRGGLRGMVIDFEGMTSADTALTRTVVGSIASAARARGVGPVVVAIPPSDTAAYPARLFAESADLLLVMLYDEHSATSPPGPISSPEWVRRTLAVRVAESGASRIVAGLPLYGYQWFNNRRPARMISFAEATRLTAEAGVALARDPASSTLHASRGGSDGWDLWVTDAALLTALQREVAALNVRRVAYWRLGLEDPAIW